MNELEQQIKKLEIREKKIKNRTIWLTVLMPLITIFISFGTTLLTINKDFDIDRLNYTQERINSLIKEDNVIEARKKIKFLIDSDLIGDKTNRDNILNALDNNLINENASMNEFLTGVKYFDIAFTSQHPDTITEYYRKSIDNFMRSIELNPLNSEARSYLATSYSNIGHALNLTSFYEKALQEYNKVLKLDSSLAYIYVNKAELYETLRQYDKICPEIKKVDSLGGLDENRDSIYTSLRKTYCNK